LLKIVFAQKSSTGIYQQLKKLNVLGSVLYIAAHPDDENNSLLPYLAKEKMYRTAYLSLTRGDGGQNLIGSEQGIELGLIRTQELLAARKIDGAEQYFTSAYEFGFSKNAKESLTIWNKEKVLSDVVWMIRSYQPDIIIKRFPPDARAGHGHHAASAILADEAFQAAADPNRFPEQLKDGKVKVWQTKKIFWNTYNFGSSNTTSNTQLKFDIGVYNSLLGMSYGEVGGIARSMHKSQGEGRPQRKGSIIEYFATKDSSSADLMNGITTDWTRIKGGDSIQTLLNKILQQYNFEKPQMSVTDLIRLYKTLQNIPDQNNWVKLKMAALQQLIMDCIGLYTEAVTDNEYAIQGEKFTANFFINNRLGNNVRVDNIQLQDEQGAIIDTNLSMKLSPNQNVSFAKQFQIDNQKKISQTYWLESTMNNGMFTINNPSLIGFAENSEAYTASFYVTIEGVSFVVKKPLQYKYVDPVKGELFQPVVVTPPFIVSLSPANILVNTKPDNRFTKNKIVQLQCKSLINSINTKAKIQIKQGEKIVFEMDTLLSFSAGKTFMMDFSLQKIYLNNADKNLSVSIGIPQGEKESFYNQNLRKIAYDHIPNINYFTEETIHILSDEIKIVPNKKVGYIIGAGDKVPEALQQLGCSVTYLNEKDITLEILQSFDAIVTGIRAYNMNEWLTNKNDVLNNFVEKGGNLIIQYLKSNIVGNNKINAGPYSFSVNAQSRVTEENAVVNFLLPNHSIFNFPNKITTKDFEGWVQERSTYQAEKMDNRFESLIAMNDTGEKESNGSLITAKYGKGNITYVSLVMFRQLPAGIAGAYKLMANLIAQPKNK